MLRGGNLQTSSHFLLTGCSSLVCLETRFKWRRYISWDSFCKTVPHSRPKCERQSVETTLPSVQLLDIPKTAVQWWICICLLTGFNWFENSIRWQLIDCTSQTKKWKAIIVLSDEAQCHRTSKSVTDCLQKTLEYFCIYDEPFFGAGGSLWTVLFKIQ